MFSLQTSLTWPALILLPMHEANTCRFITHVCDLNWHHFSLSRLNQSLHSVLLCPRTSYLTNYSQHVFAPNIFAWQALILLPMHEANTCRFITHVCDFNWHYFSLPRLNQSLQSVLLCPRTSYLPNFSQHVFAVFTPGVFHLTSFDLVANAWSKHMQVHHARLRFKLAPL